jgi:hypothetical protein
MKSHPVDTNWLQDIFGVSSEIALQNKMEKTYDAINTHRKRIAAAFKIADTATGISGKLHRLRKTTGADLGKKTVSAGRGPATRTDYVIRGENPKLQKRYTLGEIKARKIRTYGSLAVLTAVTSSCVYPVVTPSLRTPETAIPTGTATPVSLPETPEAGQTQITEVTPTAPAATVTETEVFTATPTPDVMASAREKLSSVIAQSGGEYRLTDNGGGNLTIEAIREYPDAPHDWPEPTPTPLPAPEWQRAIELTPGGAVIHITDYYNGEAQADITIPLAELNPVWDQARDAITVTDPDTGKQYAYHQILGTWISTERRSGIPTRWEAANVVDLEQLESRGMDYMREWTATQRALDLEQLEKFPGYTVSHFGQFVTFPICPFHIDELFSDTAPVLSVSQLKIDGHTDYILGMPAKLQLRTSEGLQYTDTYIYYFMIEDDGTFNWYQAYSETNPDAINAYENYIRFDRRIADLVVNPVISPMTYQVFVWTNPANEDPLYEDSGLAERYGFAGALLVYNFWNSTHQYGTFYNVANAYNDINMPLAERVGLLEELQDIFLPVFRTMPY